MNKERTVGLIFFGNITDEEIKSIPKDFHGDIIVIGNIRCKGKCVIPGSLWLNGDLFAQGLDVEGGFYTKVGTTIVISGGINVSEDFILKEAGEIRSRCINVGGDFEGEGTIISTSIDVYGRFAFKGKINSGGNKIRAGELEIDAVINECGGIKSGW